MGIHAQWSVACRVPILRFHHPGESLFGDIWKWLISKIEWVATPWLHCWKPKGFQSCIDCRMNWVLEICPAPVCHLSEIMYTGYFLGYWDSAWIAQCVTQNCWNSAAACSHWLSKPTLGRIGCFFSPLWLSALPVLGKSNEASWNLCDPSLHAMLNYQIPLLSSQHSRWSCADGWMKKLTLSIRSRDEPTQKVTWVRLGLQDILKK